MWPKHEEPHKLTLKNVTEQHHTKQLMDVLNLLLYTPAIIQNLQHLSKHLLNYCQTPTYAY